MTQRPAGNLQLARGTGDLLQYEYYVDDGYTGRSFNRLSFQRMIVEVKVGKVGCVVTKDLSRLGRNYIEIFFPKHNVRYIAITGGMDRLTRQEMDITPFKNILNDVIQTSSHKKSGKADVSYTPASPLVSLFLIVFFLV